MMLVALKKKMMLMMMKVMMGMVMVMVRMSIAARGSPEAVLAVEVTMCTRFQHSQNTCKICPTE